MASLLRRPQTVARSSHQLLEAASLSNTLARRPSSLPRPLYAYARRRNYATDPKDQNSKDATPADGSKASPAKGMEHLYNKSSPMSPQNGTQSPGSKGEREGPLPGRSRFNAQEEEAFTKIFDTVKMGMPKSLAQDVDKALQKLRKDGIPDELRATVQEAAKEGMTPSRAAKLFRLISQLARQTTDELLDERARNSESHKTPFESSSPSAKEESKKESNKSKQKEDAPPGFEFKLDLPNILVSAFLSYLVYRMVVPGENSREITWQEFRTTFLDKGLVEKLVVVNGNRVRVYLHRESVAAAYPDSPAAQPGFFYFFSIGSVEAFERRVDGAQNELGIPSSERIPISYHEEGSLMGPLLAFGPTLLIIGAFVWMSRRAASGSGGGASGIFGMGRSRAKKFNHETDVKVKFSDVAGMDEAKAEIMEFVSFLKTPEIYQRLGAKIPRGAILSGPPGTGKTLLAKATAGESGVPFFSVSGSEFVEMFVGVGASRVRDLFANARKNAPSIVFIDEIDAIGRARGKANFNGGNDEREATLNQILTEMDGFNTTEQVVVLAGTNRADTLDKALVRPGRFDRHINVDPPTMEGRKQIFAVHINNIVTNEEMEHLKGKLAALTPGFSGAQISMVVNEAALVAARRKADSVVMKDFEQAIERVIGGLENKSLVLSPKEKRTIAYHEAGHAICGWYFEYADPLLKVSIIPRGSTALGYAQYLPGGGRDEVLMNAKQLMDRMAMTLGGRVSEELHFDTVTSGASDDFNKVTRMARAMVTKWGMSPLGFCYFPDPGETQETQLQKPFSESTAQAIDAEVKKIVNEAYKQCRTLLEEKKKEIGIVAEELLSKEVLGREDMIRLLGKRTWDDDPAFSKYFGGGAIPPKAGPIISEPGAESNTPNDLPPQLGGGQGAAAPSIFKRTP